MCIKSGYRGGVSACSEIVNLVVVFLLLPVAASGEFCSAKLQSWFWCVLLCVFSCLIFKTLVNEIVHD